MEIRQDLMFLPDGMVKLEESKVKIQLNGNLYEKCDLVSRTFYLWIVYRGGVCCWCFSPGSANYFTPLINNPGGKNPPLNRFKKFTLRIIESLEEVVVCGKIEISMIIKVRAENSGYLTPEYKKKSRKVELYYERRNGSAQGPRGFIFGGVYFRKVTTNKTIQECLELWYAEHERRRLKKLKYGCDYEYL